MKTMLHRLMTITTILALTFAVAPTPDADAKPFPDTIELPDGFFPEGITIDAQRQVGYVGSLAGGAIQMIDLKTGESTELAPAVGPTAVAVGMTVDSHDRLWVASGGPVFSPATIPGFRVYDTNTGALLLDMPIAAGFVNDIIVTDDAAWLTDSFTANLIRVPIARDGSIGSPETVALEGDWVQPAGFGANGIAATPNGKQLIVAQATGPEAGSSALYLVPSDTVATSLDATRISLDEPLQSGDGLILNGRTLWVVGGPGVTKIDLNGQLTSGEIVDVLEVPGALTPTTGDAFGSKLYVVDAKFPLLGDPTASFAVTVIAR